MFWLSYILIIEEEEDEDEEIAAEKAEMCTFCKLAQKFMSFFVFPFCQILHNILLDKS